MYILKTSINIFELLQIDFKSLLYIYMTMAERIRFGNHTNNLVKKMYENNLKCKFYHTKISILSKIFILCIVVFQNYCE